jgi:hypothetical protein
MSNDTIIEKANGKCSIPNNKNTKCDCVVEKFENNNENGKNNLNIQSYTNILLYVLKFALITFFIYLVFSYFQK